MMKGLVMACGLLLACAVVAQTPAGTTTGELQLLKERPPDSTRVNLLLSVSDRYLYHTPQASLYLDSSLYYARLAEALSNKLDYKKGLGNSYEQYSKIFQAKKDLVKGKFYAEKAVAVFTQNNFFMELGYAWFDLSGYYSFYGNELAERIRLLEKCLSAFKLSGSRRKVADAHKELADLLQIQGENQLALDHLQQSLQLYQAIGYPNQQGTYDLMGSISGNLGDFEHALQYGLLAVKTADQVRDTSLQIATIYNRVGVTYEHLKKYQQAYEYWRKSLTIVKKYHDNDGIVNLTANVAKALIQLKRPEEALLELESLPGNYRLTDHSLRLLVASRFLITYQELKRYAMAGQYCNELLRISRNLDRYDMNQHMVYEAVIPYYLTTKQFADAGKYLRINEDFCRRRTLPLGLSNNYFWQFTLDSMQRNYVAAIGSYEQYKTLQDSLLNEATGKQVEQLQIQYETEKKDRDLQLKEQNIQLLTKHTQLQQTQLGQERLIKNVTIAGIGLLLVIVALLYNQSRLRQRNHKELQAQQKEINQQNLSLQRLVDEKEWLVKEIHHRVKNNFHIVVGLLATQSSYLKNEEALLAISESQHRIHVMSLIHQKLYQSENLSRINMPGYIHELVEYLKDSFSTGTRIQFNMEIEPLELDLAHAVPLGLILNEAITNSIKYAFAGPAAGKISVVLKRSGNERILLRIADDGRGMPRGVDPYRRSSMGMNLMQGLSEDIGAAFSIRSKQGTQIEIAFDYELQPATHITPVNT